MPYKLTIPWHNIIKIIISAENSVRTVVFNIGNVCHANKAWVLHGVDPEEKVNQDAVRTRHSSRQATHVVVIINESDGKPRCRVQRDTNAPYIPLRSDTRNCTYRRNGVADLQQHIISSRISRASNINLSTARSMHPQTAEWYIYNISTSN